VTLAKWLRALVGTLVYGALVFVPAGTLRWVEGWVLLGLLLGSGVRTVVILRRGDPGLLDERSGGIYRAGQPLWDRVWLSIFMLSYFSWIGVGGWDAVRHEWSHVPVWIEVLGGLAVVAGLEVVLRVFRENSFASPTVRIQQERGQVLVDTGPYAVVRHPMYAAMLLLFPGGSLLLGSLASLVLSLVLLTLLVVRIPGEERVLHDGLDGYAEYCTRVRHRLIPGVW
jgi:protein-S-isoprenylcysteine O-methyltransferase Ste14